MNPPPEDPASKRSADWRATMREVSPYLGLGMQLALTMVFFTGAGYLLDWWLALTPWLTVAGALLGMTAVFVQLIRISQRAGSPSKSARKPPRERPGPPPAAG